MLILLGEDPDDGQKSVTGDVGSIIDQHSQQASWATPNLA